MVQLLKQLGCARVCAGRYSVMVGYSDEVRLKAQQEHDKELCANLGITKEYLEKSRAYILSQAQKGFRKQGLTVPKTYSELMNMLKKVKEKT